jgi:hypothetical protein
VSLTATAQALPYVAWVLLVTLAVGTFVFVAITRERAAPTRGYLDFGAWSAALLAVLALLTDWGLPPATELVIQPAPPTVDTIRQTGLAAFSLLAIVYYAALRSRIPVLPVAVLTTAAALVTLAAAAFGWAPTGVDAVPLLVQLCMLSAITGGSLAAIALGHWYLVTPKLSEAPLVLQTRMLIALLAVQILLFVVWTTLGGGPGQAAFDAFTEGPILLVIMRAAITLVFPLVLCYMAMRTAQTRSMESATGLLYINLAAVMAGTIGAAALYVSAGLLL